MKITDMNLICLEECLEHLELDDLLRVADSNKRLCKAAEPVFLQKYGHKRFEFGNESSSSEIFSIDEECVIISDWKFCCQLLRCFGHLIVSWDHKSYDKDQLVFTYLNEYCAESLTEMSFSEDHSDLDSLNQLNKPFVNVKKVELNSCQFAKAGWLKSVFPNMRYLRYCPWYNSQINSIADHFPHLEYLHLLCYNENAGESILECLRLNPQLKTLELIDFSNRLCFDEDSLRNIIESMENLVKLRLDGGFAQLSNFTGNMIRSNSVKNFNFYGTFGINGKCPFTFDRLERFSQSEQHMDDFYEFIDRHPAIKEISVRAFGVHWTNINVKHVIKALPLLKEIDLWFVPVSVDDVIELASGSKLLQKIELHTCGVQQNVEELQARLCDEWQVSEHNGTRLDLSRLTKIE